jgi:hypothetical protein
LGSWDEITTLKLLSRAHPFVGHVVLDDQYLLLGPCQTLAIKSSEVGETSEDGKNSALEAGRRENTSMTKIQRGIPVRYMVQTDPESRWQAVTLMGKSLIPQNPNNRYNRVLLLPHKIISCSSADNSILHGVAIPKIPSSSI